MDAPVAQAQTPTTPEKNGERGRAVDAAILQIEKQFGAAPSCASATAAPSRSRAFPPARSRSTWPSASAACRAAGSSRSSARSRAARPPSATTSWPTPSGRRRGRLHRRRARPRPRLGQERLGVDLDELLVSQPDTGEQALEIAEMLIRSNAVDVVVIDSVAALVPRPRSRARWATARRPAGPADEPGAAQAHRRHQPQQDGADLHQPDPREDRRHVRQPGDDPGRPGAEVLRRRAARHPPHRDAQERPMRSATAPASRWSRTRSPRRSARPSSTSCTTRASAARAACSTSASPPASSSKTGAWFNYGDTRLGQGRENAKRLPQGQPGDRHQDRG